MREVHHVAQSEDQREAAREYRQQRAERERVGELRGAEGVKKRHLAADSALDPDRAASYDEDTRSHLDALPRIGISVLETWAGRRTHPCRATHGQN